MGLKKYLCLHPDIESMAKLSREDLEILEGKIGFERVRRIFRYTVLAEVAIFVLLLLYTLATETKIKPLYIPGDRILFLVVFVFILYRIASLFQDVEFGKLITRKSSRYVLAKVNFRRGVVFAGVSIVIGLMLVMPATQALMTGAVEETHIIEGEGKITLTTYHPSGLFRAYQVQFSSDSSFSVDVYNSTGTKISHISNADVYPIPSGTDEYTFYITTNGRCIVTVKYVPAEYLGGYLPTLFFIVAGIHIATIPYFYLIMRKTSAEAKFE